ncbi:MAG TPA: NAD-dependent epimerase/dehydratase family protein [Polyangia bacterium]|nr:NAD-dependent epimerase/dehydratase family protein [Polyangia bacterium]
MSATTRIEPERAFDGPIAVSGAAGRLGNLVVRHLHRTDEVVSIDPRGFGRRPRDVPHLQAELGSRKSRDLFRRGAARAVVHLGPYHLEVVGGREGFARAIEGFSRLLDYCDRYQVTKLVLLSAADVYGARPGNPQFLTEEAPLLAADLSALRDVDMMAQSFFWKRHDVETVILRPAHIAGAVNSAMARYLRLDPVPRLMGYDPMLQLVHENDVVSAIRLALAPGHRGVFNLAGPPPLPLTRILERLGRRSVPVPHFLARPALARLNRLGRVDLNPAHVDYIRFVCMVDDSRARASLGYAPAFDIDETLAAIDLWS